MIRKGSTILLLIGLVLLGYVGYQKLTVQQTLSVELEKAKEVVVQAEGQSTKTADESAKKEPTDRKAEREPDMTFANGETLGFLSIRSLDMELPLLEGVDEATLAKELVIIRKRPSRDKRTGYSSPVTTIRHSRRSASCKKVTKSNCFSRTVRTDT